MTLISYEGLRNQMGYNTYFDLSVDKNADVIDAHIKSADNDDLHYHLESYDGEWSGYGKWYDHEEDMKVLSATFPDVLFTLKGDGEETNDLWIKYFKNGKMQVATAIITYEPFDESRLS